ncbi:MAG TPA: TIGR02996 domain-containing protein, partial [Gemmata sp.]|nr:TIGR02996 domain-containing protein [Gemmata sp.]
MIHSHDALYRAICAMPDEDTPRLAYADLIEEEGDDLDARRAAFIRAQIALANAREYDPLYISTKQLDPDVLYGWGMAHALPRVPGGYGWEKFEFRRGFPWKVGVQSLQAFVGDGGAVFATAPIQALDIFRQPRL